MCGICGLINDDPNRPVDPAVLTRMNEALRHRGPDDAGLWHDGSAGLAMRRLGVIDLAGGHQPMMNRDGSVVVVFNGEIYNYRELRDNLIALGHTFATQSDTEVILHAYEQYGEEALLRFNGMFAIAIHDLPRKRTLLTRDRLGIKPLYYGIRGGTLAFASELDALMRSGLFAPKLNPAALDAFFEFLYIPAPDTIFSGIHKMLPGERLVWENGRATTEPYWKLMFRPDRSWTLHTAAEAYRHLLEDAIRLQRVSDVPLGAFLSGGIDSSSVVGILSGMSEHPVKTFTIGFEDRASDETRFARLAAERFHTDHTKEILRPDMIAITPELVRHFGEPFADSSAIPTWLVSRLARQHVTVALSGDGGDELFAGYTWTRMNRNVARYRLVPAPLRHLMTSAFQLFPESPLAQKLRRFHMDSFLEPRASFRRRETCFSPPQRTRMYQQVLRDRFQELAVRNIDRFAERAVSGPRAINEWMLYQDTSFYLPDDILTKVDRMSMAHALEARVPLLDHRLVEFAASLPFSLKLAKGISKRIVKHALADMLPPELLTQRKQGFGIPIQRWFREDLRTCFEETVLAPEARCAQLLDQEPIRALYEAHIRTRENNGHHLWALFMFEHWMRYIEEDLLLTPSL